MTILIAVIHYTVYSNKLVWQNNFDLARKHRYTFQPNITYGHFLLINQGKLQLNFTASDKHAFNKQTNQIQFIFFVCSTEIIM